MSKLFNFHMPWGRVNWKTSGFLFVVNILTVTVVPLYLWRYGIDWFQAIMFFFFFIATGLSITLGYHRLFSHLSFKAKPSVKLISLLFGACAFENSALDWASDHRKHHKHVDHDDDPYDISKGFFWAHIGWLLFKLTPEQPMDNVSDLRRDKLVMWQHQWCIPIAFILGLGLPVILGYFWNGAEGALGGFLLAGVLRIFAVQHSTFFINSVCHTFGRRPYSTRCSARDSAIMALFTFGEGYHNYHHEFQHDYRNGVKKTSFDPTKWTIWLLEKIGLANDLRRVAEEKILLAEIDETNRKAEEKLKSVGEGSVNSEILIERNKDNAEKLRQVVAEKSKLPEAFLRKWRKEARDLDQHLCNFKRKQEKEEGVNQNP